MWLTDHPSLRIGTIALGGMLVLTAAWIGRDDVALSRLDVIDLGRAVLIAGACIGLLKAVSWRLQEDTTATAQWFCKTASVVQLVIASLLVLMTASAHAAGLSAAERDMPPGAGIEKFISLAGTFAPLVAAAETAHREAMVQRKRNTQ